MPLTPDDRFALADLVARYAAAVDARDFDRLRDIFLAGCRFDTGRAVRDGVDSVIEAMQGLLRYEATSHMLGQQLLDQHDGDSVSGVTYCTAHHLTDHGDRRTDKVMHIRYHDQFRRHDDGWRIAERRLDLIWSDEQPVG